MLPHSYGERCLACSTNNQRANGVYVHCRMKKPKENPRPKRSGPNSPKGQTCACDNHVDDYMCEEHRILFRNAPRLVDALELCLVWMEPVMDGFKVPKEAESRVQLEKAKALLRECKKL